MSETERDARSLRSFRHSVFPSHITYLRSYFVPSVVTPPVPLRSITRPKVEWVNGVKEVTRVRACSHPSSVQPLPLVVIRLGSRVPLTHDRRRREVTVRSRLTRGENDGEPGHEGYDSYLLS